MPLPTSLVVKNGSKIVSSRSGAMPVPVSATEMATKSPLRADWARSGGMASHLADADGQPAFAVHGIAAVDGEIDQRGLELRDVGDRKAIGIGNVDVDPDPAADQRTDQLRHRLDLGADIEHLRLQRLPAGERQQLPGQLGGALHRLGDRVDVAPAPLFRQFAAAQEVGRGADDGQEIVEIVRDAAGQLADRFHLLRLAQRFLALAALGDVDGLRHRADDRAVLVAQRAHREVEIALADRQMQPHLGLDFFAPHDGDEGVADGVAHAVGRGEPRRFPERLADHVAGVGADAGERRLVGIEHVAVQVEQALILMAGLEDRAHLRFVGFELRGALGDAQFQGFVQPAQIDLGLLGGGDVVGDADEADMLAGRIPARLRFRAQPAPFAVGVAGSGLPARTASARLRRRSIPAGCAAGRPDAAPCASRTRWPPRTAARGNRDRPGWRRSACGRAW